MDLEGRIDVTLVLAGEAVASARVVATRPQLAQRLLVGRTPGESAALVGTLFSLCGHAQRAACECACAAAAGEPDPTPGAVAAILAEIAQEHAWRLLLDWPRVSESGVPPDPDALLALRRATARPNDLAGTLSELLNRLLGEPAAQWLERDPDALECWLDAGAAPVARLLAGSRGVPDRDREPLILIPALEALVDGDLAVLADLALADPGFCARPRWQGGPAETGALARQGDNRMLAGWLLERGRGAGARLLARLVELSAMPGWLMNAGPTVIRALALGEGAGLAAVETARGLLIHAVRLDDGRVSQYRIIAPTEWNCASDGPLVAALSGLAPGPGLERRARVAVTAIDPCVAYGLEIRDA